MRRRMRGVKRKNMTWRSLVAAVFTDFPTAAFFIFCFER